MNSRKDIERSASTQGQSVRSERTRNVSKRRRQSTAQFKKFYVKNFKLNISPFEGQSTNQTSFQQLFALMNQACTFLPQECSIENKQKTNTPMTQKQMSPSDVLNTLTNKLVASKQRYSQLFNQMSQKEQSLTEAKAEIQVLKITNTDLRQKINDLRQQIVFWREGHQKMLKEGQNIRVLQNKQNIDNIKSNKLKEFKKTIIEQRKMERSKLKIVKPVNGVMGLFGKGFVQLKDCGIQSNFFKTQKNCFQSISLCQSLSQNRSLLLQTNTCLQQDLRFAEEYANKLKAKVDFLQMKLLQERQLFKIQKERQFALLKQKLRFFLSDYNTFKLHYEELKSENSMLMKTHPHQQSFRLSLSPNSKLI